MGTIHRWYLEQPASDETGMVVDLECTPKQHSKFLQPDYMIGELRGAEIKQNHENETQW